MPLKDDIVNFYKRVNPIPDMRKVIDEQSNKIDELIKSSNAETVDFRRLSNSGQGNLLVSNPAAINTVVIEDAYVRAMVNKVINKVMTGFGEAVPKEDVSDEEAEQQIKQYEEWAKTAGGASVPNQFNKTIPPSGEDISFKRIVRKWVDSIYCGDDYYIELVYPREKMGGDGNQGLPITNVPFQEMHIQDWGMMVINRDANGRLKDLTFDKKGNRASGAYHKMIEGRIATVFDKKEIIHGNMWGKGTSAYGWSKIRSLLFTASSKRFGQAFSTDTFINQKPKQVVQHFTNDEEQYNKEVDQWEDSKDKPNVDIHIMAAPGTNDNPEGTVITKTLTTAKDLEYAKTIEDTRGELMVGGGVPPGSIYAPNSQSNWEANIQLHEFDDDINCLRDFIDDDVNTKIFPRLGWDLIKFKFRKANKRDELNEIKAALGKLKYMSLNEVRKEQGLPPSPDPEHDEIGTSQPSPFGGDGAPRIEDDTDNRGLMAQHFHTYNLVKRNTENQKRKLSDDSPAIQSNKKLLKSLFKFENEYTKQQVNILKNFLNEVVGILKSKGEEIVKIVNPDKQMKEIDDAIAQFKINAKQEATGTVRKAYDFGVDDVADELGIIIAKSTTDFESLQFFDNMNIELMEGAYSDIAKDVKTQIRVGLQQQESIPQITKRIKGRVKSVEKTYKNRFRTIARTEIARAQSEGRLNSYKNSGVVQKVQVIVGTGPDPQGICESAFRAPPGSLSSPMTIEEARGMIPQHPSCSCSIIPVVE